MEFIEPATMSEVPAWLAAKLRQSSTVQVSGTIFAELRRVRAYNSVSLEPGTGIVERVFAYTTMYGGRTPVDPRTL